MFLHVSLSNSKFSLVSHSCRSCSARVALMSLVWQLCRTHVASVASCCIRVARVALVSLVSGTRIVN